MSSMAVSGSSFFGIIQALEGRYNARV